MQAAHRAGLTLNSEKCQFGIQEVVFLGDVVSKEGIKPDPSLLDTILNLEAPTNKKAVQRMIGVINYFGKYIPRLSEHTANLRRLLHECVLFEWTQAHDHEWKQLKLMLTSAPVLALFDPDRTTKLSADASKDGIGVALLQLHDRSWRPVVYASRSLSDCESRYSQIEKEALGLVFGCERFHHLTYGRHIILETDHSPLVALSKKSIGDVPPRLQRFFLRLMKYDFTLQFLPGKKLVLADALSRAVQSGSQEKQYSLDVEVHAVGMLGALVSEATQNLLRTETKKDPELQHVLRCLQNRVTLQGDFSSLDPDLSVIDGIPF